MGLSFLIYYEQPKIPKTIRTHMRGLQVYGTGVVVFFILLCVCVFGVFVVLCM